MPDLRMPWAPRLLLTNRTFRLPVQTSGTEPDPDLGPFQILDRRWSAPDSAFFYYLQAPSQSGDYVLRAAKDGRKTQLTIQVRTLDQLRQPFRYNDADWPRRWPINQPWHSTKTAQTLQDLPIRQRGDAETLNWWLEQDDRTVWRQLPPAEFPRAHYVNVHQGCPNCGTAIFAHHGFYPWTRNYLPADLRSECPSCGAVYPDNDLAGGDFTSGDFVDDGFGYFDDQGHVFLFAASYHREQIDRFSIPIDQLTNLLRRDHFDPETARRLGLLLLRYAVETVYLAAAPQFRHGPSQEEEKAWDWGQPDWASANDPIAILYRKGILRYSIDVPSVGASLALAYDTIWPFLREDRELPDRARAMGLHLERPADVVSLIEEMLASQLQCCLDGGGLSNMPRVSEGVLTMLRGLDRPDAGDVLDWLYDRGPEKLRGFTANNFFPDGTPPEATGGYNDIHSQGLFALEYQLRRLRLRHPEAYPESRFPSLLDRSRARRILRAPHEVILLGRVPFHFGDGGSAGVQTPLQEDARLTPLPVETLRLAEEYLDDPEIADLRREVEEETYHHIDSSLLDGAGFAILRTGETPERAAAGIVYGDAPYHRHMDLFDVQLYAFGRPFLSDLGYPQSWASVHYWEGHWATHNSVWSVVPEQSPLELPFDTPYPFLKQIAGRGRLVRTLFLDRLQVVEIEAERWAWDMEQQRWHRPGVHFRRLLGLVETDGEGVALIDLARVTGGAEHWRVCRGLEGDFIPHQIEQTSLPGTVAGPDIERGQLNRLAHPDHAGLACMDQVARLQTSAAWSGTWHSHHDPSAHLDLHLLRAPANAETLTARATAVMGSPDQSRYTYRALLWRHRPTEPEMISCFDQVFEPRLGEATLAAVEALPTEDGLTASGIRLQTRTGREISLYWNPQSPTDGPIRFADGTELSGGLVATLDGELASTGAETVHLAGRSHRFPSARQTGTITALDRDACTVELSGLSDIAVGDRVCVRSSGRSYRITAVSSHPSGRHRLTLDLSSVLGRARIAALRGTECELDFFLITRTGYLHDTRLERELDGSWQPIIAAMNPDMDRSVVQLENPLEEAREGDWVRAVAYVVGDQLLFEPLCRDAV